VPRVREVPRRKNEKHLINLSVSLLSVFSRGGTVERRGRYTQYISTLLCLFIFNPFYCRHLRPFPPLHHSNELSPSVFPLASREPFYVSAYVGRSEWCFNNRISLNFLGEIENFALPRASLRAVPHFLNV